MRLILLGKMVQNYQKRGFCATFGQYWGTPKWTEKDTQSPTSGRIVSDLKNKPLTKSLGPFFREKWSETTVKQLFQQFLVIFGINKWLFWPIG
jgi:hypothetical protein